MGRFTIEKRLAPGRSACAELCSNDREQVPQPLGAACIDGVALTRRNVRRHAEEEPCAVRQKLELPLLRFLDHAKTTRQRIKTRDDDGVLSLMSRAREAVCNRFLDQVGLTPVPGGGEPLQRVSQVGGHISGDLYSGHWKVSAFGAVMRGRAAEVAIDAELTPDGITLIDRRQLR